MLGLFALLAVGAAHNACAQRRGPAGPRFARGGYGFRRAQAASPYRPGYARQPYGLGYAYLSYGSGAMYPGYDFGPAYPYAPQPVLFVQQPPLLVEAPEPPAVQPTGHPVITEYKWPTAGAASSRSASSTASDSEPQDFTIVLKDGSTLSAVMVYASDDGLHCIDSDDRHLRLAVSEVDRAATLKLNRARNLNLHLPAAQ